MTSMVEVRMFPGDNRSVAQLKRIKTLFRETEESIDMVMYVFTHH